jgi:hypothetical protein
MRPKKISGVPWRWKRRSPRHGRGGEVELRAVALDELQAPEVADRVADRGAREVAEEAGEDHGHQRVVVLVDVVAGEQHRDLGGHGNARRAHR